MLVAGRSGSWRLAGAQRRSGRRPASQHIGVVPAAPGTATGECGARMAGDEHPAPSLILAAITGVAILTAGAVQILLAR